MTTSTLSPRDTQETIAEIARLLHHAADRTAHHAATEGPRSELHVFGLGLHVAAAEVALLVPPDLDRTGRSPPQTTRWSCCASPNGSPALCPSPTRRLAFPRSSSASRIYCARPGREHVDDGGSTIDR